MKSQKAYWEAKIIDWEKSVYSRRILSSKLFLEKIATPFRKLLKKRMAIAETLLANYIKGKIVMDLGCGSGIFLISLLKYKPKKLIGIDIAQSAIKIANQRIKKLGLKGKIEFLCTDVRKPSISLQLADTVTGIGFIDYLNKQELINLFKKIGSKNLFLFSFPAKIFSLREILHRVYLILISCPGSHKYSRKEMDAILERAGIEKWWYYDKKTIRFITNLPRQNS